ncbi:AraC family transcriptional regulator [uncultured Roseovarius sp.]|uniref:AraC family transcriptional regulator n=1 Tax=uncultured Roseovarius sp. TaxID=293344 RepID=UPI00261FAA1F|nr:AraC family transcriptional regulator [uncultured Roseovarius sp.]
MRLDRRLALVRATHLIDYISVLREIGAPVDRDLARSLLPPRIEETPDLYVSVPVALEWIARTGHDLNLMELGLRGAQNASLASLLPAQQAAILTAQTGLMRLEALAAIAQTEDSALDMHLLQEGDNLRVICSMTGLNNHIFICLAEWLNVQAVISVIRSIMGASWCPSEICFVSKACVPQVVLAAFPNTRILMGQPQTSVVVSRAELSQPTCALIGAANNTVPSLSSRQVKDGQSACEFISLLRMMVQPYLNDERIDVAFAADIAGVSTRTLQRRLKLSGSSYSQIVQEARFDLARSHLDEPGMKVIDVAMMAGYDSPQHFTRAFRRFTGVTPTQYRNESARRGLLTNRAST